MRAECGWVACRQSLLAPFSHSPPLGHSGGGGGGEGGEERAVMAPERGVQSMGTGSSRGTEGGAGSSTPAKFMIILVYFLETFLWQNTSSSVKP